MNVLQSHDPNSWATWGNPLHSLAQMASVARRGGSLKLQVLMASTTADLEILQRDPSWTVGMRTFSVHAPRKLGLRTGLFGTLGMSACKLLTPQTWRD